MLRCKACILETLSIVFADAVGQPCQPILTAVPPHLYGRTRSLLRRPLWSREQYRSYATSLYVPNGPQEPAEGLLPPAPVRSPIRPLSKPGQSHAVTVKEPEPSVYKRTELEKEYRWLRDPLKLADRVAGLLGDGDYFKALALTRMASKDLLCTVAWNHLVNYDMSQGKAGAAVKTYNEVRLHSSLRYESSNSSL